MSKAARRSVVVLDDVDEDRAGQQRQQSSSSFQASISNVESESSFGGTQEELFMPKNERFAQLLAMRQQKRKDAIQKCGLEVEEEMTNLASPGGPGSPKGLKRSLSTSSFAALPTTTQYLRKVMASIDNALEEQRQEEARRELEEQLALEAKIQQGALVESHHGGNSRLDISELLDRIHHGGKGKVNHGTPAGAGPPTNSPGGGSSPTKVVELRVMTHTDFALKHKITVHTTDTSGVDELTSLVAGKSAPLIPKASLLVPDEPILFDLQLETATAKGKKGALGRAGARKKVNQSSSSQPQEAQASRAPRMPIEDLMRSYNEHCLVTNNALQLLRRAAASQGIDAVQMKRLQEREDSRFCEPIPGIKTIFYFPSAQDELQPDKEEGRIRQLQRCARVVATGGLSFTPLVWEYITSSERCCLLNKATREFPTTFEFVVSITPKQLYLNLERMSRGLVSPLVLRKIVYSCCSRDPQELVLWSALYQQYRVAVKHHTVSQFVQRYKKVETKKKGGRNRSIRGEATLTSKEDSSEDTLPGSFSQARYSPSSGSVRRRSSSASAAFHRAETATVDDEVIAKLSDSDDVDGENLDQYPFHLVDFALQNIIEGWLEDTCSERSQVYEPFDRWFASALVHADRVSEAFRSILLMNSSEKQLLDAYHLLLPSEANAKRRTFETNLSDGFLPPTDVWIPPNATLKLLEDIENVLSAKGPDDLDSQAVARFLAMFRERYFAPVAKLIGHCDEGFAQDVSFEAKSEAKKIVLKFDNLPESLLSATVETMHPSWPPVEGWERADRGGFAERPGEVPPRKKKGDEFAASSKTILMNESPMINSIGVPFAPTPYVSPEEQKKRGSSKQSTRKQLTSSKSPQSVALEPSGAHATPLSESLEFDLGMSGELGMELDSIDSSAPTKPSGPCVNPRYADWDPRMLYDGQGLYFEAFVRCLCTSPAFAKDCLGVVLRQVVHFPSYQS